MIDCALRKRKSYFYESKMRLKACLLFTLLTAIGYGQTKKVINDLGTESQNWFDGSITLNDQTAIKGLVQYNDKNGVLSIKDEDGSQSFSAKTVSKFQFFDSNTSEYRNFISIEYPTEAFDKGILGYDFSLNDYESRKDKGPILPTFFEIVRETKSFIVLSKVKPIVYKQKAKGNNAGSFTTFGGGSPVTISTVPGVARMYDEVRQNELIFFADTLGNIIPYAEFVDKEEVYYSNQTNGIKKSKSRKIDSNALERITGSYYTELLKYAESNKLKIKKREDFIKVIDYFISISDSR